MAAKVLTCPSCDVADALLKLGVPNGGILPSLKLWSPEHQAGTTKIVGPAYTVQYSKVGEARTSSSPQGHFVRTPEGLKVEC